MTPTIDLAAVIPAAQAGDKVAQDALMTTYYGWSITQAKRTLRNSEQAHNVAVEFWAWLFQEKGINTYDPSMVEFYSWASMVIRSRALKAAGKPQPQVMYFSEVNDPDTWNTSGDPARQLSAVQDLEAVAKSLKSGQHKAVFWRLIEGATPKEIAEELEISIKRARNLIGEVRAVIQQQIGESDEK